MSRSSSIMMAQLPQPKTNYKVAIIGGEKTGKSALLDRAIANTFSADYLKDIVRFRRKELAGTAISLSIADIGGETKNIDAMASYLYGVDTLLIVWDVTDRASFAAVNNFLTMAKASVPPQCKFIFVANKIDLGAARVVTQQEGADFAADNDAHYLEVSALSGENVETLFKACASRHATKIPSKSLNTMIKRPEPVKNYSVEVKKCLDDLELQLTLNSIGELAVPGEVNLNPDLLSDLIQSAAWKLHKSAQYSLFDKQITKENGEDFCRFLQSANNLVTAYYAWKADKDDVQPSQTQDEFVNKWLAFSKEVDQALGKRNKLKIAIGAGLCLLGVALIAASVLLSLATFHILSVPAFAGVLVGLSLLEYAAAGLTGAAMMVPGCYLWHTGRQKGPALEGKHLADVFLKDKQIKPLLQAEKPIIKKPLSFKSFRAH
jgi:small GTP-binding protein